MNNKTIFGKNVKMLREERGLGQIELAEILQVSKGIISMWENGLSDPKMSSLIALSKFFDCTIDYLVGLED